MLLKDMKAVLVGSMDFLFLVVSLSTIGSERCTKLVVRLVN